MKSKTLNHIFILCGPSGVGKTSLAKHIMKMRNDCKFSISHTSRNPRVNEEDGIDYYFVSRKQFKQMINKSKFLEHEEVYGNYYGTSYESISAILGSNFNVIIDLDFRGAETLYKRFQDAETVRVHVIKIMPPTLEELERRLIARNTDSKADILSRLQDIKQNELSYEMRCSYKEIINEDMQKSQHKIMEIVGGAFLDELTRPTQEYGGYEELP